MAGEPHANHAQEVLLVESYLPLAHLLHETVEAEPGLRVVAQVRSAREAVAVAAIRQPGLVIMDLHLPDLSGLEAVSLLQGAGCRAKIILLIEQDDLRYHQMAWQRGAAACVGKEHIAGELVAILRQVLAAEPGDAAHPDEQPTKGASEESTWSWSS
jgi:two-component system nitrate/nitrite response regulator NarL